MARPNDVPYAYPARPPPQPVTSGAADYIAAKHCCCRFIFCLACLVGVLGLIIFTLLHKDKSARFQLESVSVDNRANSTAVWNIGFSIDKSVGDLDVWIRVLSRDFKAESVGSAGHATVSVTTSLPGGFDFPGGVVALEQVMFKCNNYQQNVLKAACKDVEFGFSSNQTEGVMKGGPRLCPEVDELD